MYKARLAKVTSSLFLPFLASLAFLPFFFSFGLLICLFCLLFLAFWPFWCPWLSWAIFSTSWLFYILPCLILAFNFFVAFAFFMPCLILAFGFFWLLAFRCLAFFWLLAFLPLTSYRLETPTTGEGGVAVFLTRRDPCPFLITSGFLPRPTCKRFSGGISTHAQGRDAPQLKAPFPSDLLFSGPDTLSFHPDTPDFQVLKSEASAEEYCRSWTIKAL